MGGQAGCFSAFVSEEAEARWDTRSALGAGLLVFWPPHLPGRASSETLGWRGQAGLLTHFTDENTEGLRSDSASAGTGGVSCREGWRGKDEGAALELCVAT